MTWRQLPLLVLAGAVSVALLGAPGCTLCDRSGCDALGTPASDEGQSAIAGVLAGESDSVGNGCQECAFASATLSIWAAPAPIGDSASANTLANGAPPDVTIQADRSYRQALDPGSYLLCRRPDCVSVTVVAGHVTPVNLKLIFGPTQFVVFDPQTRAQVTAPTLEVSP
jgi:hypothetical protein